MNVLDLPPELLHIVLFYASLSRGVRRALRLRLVCKVFDDAFRPALFETRLLDNFVFHYRCGSPKFLESWYVREQHGAEKFWQSYLAYRVRNETDPQIGRFAEIRQLAETFCSRTEADFEATLEGLCWLALEQGARCPGQKSRWRNRHGKLSDKPDSGLNFLSAAAYFGHLPLTRRLLEEGHCPTQHNDLFSSPMQLAAWAGHADILQLFQEHLPEYEELNPNNWPYHWRGKTGPFSISGAAARGDLNMVRLGIYPPSRATPDNLDFVGESVGRVHPASDTGRDLRDSLLTTRHLEIFQYIVSFFHEFDQILLNVDRLMLMHVWLGHVDIVRYLLNQGANVNGTKSINSIPLVAAARAGHEDVIDLLLERGADVNYDKVSQLGSPLVAAAGSGIISLVRKLMDHGATSSGTGWFAVKHAILLEHKAMAELLLDNGIGSPKRKWLELAVEGGLESMAEFLERRRANLSDEERERIP